MLARHFRFRTLLPYVVLGVFALAPDAAIAQAQTGGGSAATGSVDYADPESWLCLPGRDDACNVNLNTTVIMPDGSFRLEEFHANPDAPFDCFYVYPTVSQEPSPNSSIAVGPGERGVAASQPARFRSQCRVFAPLYRQVTLAALRSSLGGGGMEGDWNLAYNDVRDAWRQYLTERSGGRGVVLLGHSQGSNMLLRLLQEEIEGKPVQSRIVSAVLLGWNVAVPEGAAVGGDLKHMPLCSLPLQTQCVVTYVSFRESAPPPENALFGRAAAPGTQVACTNPANLRGGPAELTAYLAANRAGMEPWVESGREVTTPFVRMPLKFFGECVSNEHGSYLEVTIADDRGPRTDVIGGDVMNADGTPNAMWGWHLYDMSLTMGDLVALVGYQYEAWSAARLR